MCYTAPHSTVLWRAHRPLGMSKRLRGDDDDDEPEGKIPELVANVYAEIAEKASLRDLMMMALANNKTMLAGIQENFLRTVIEHEDWEEDMRRVVRKFWDTHTMNHKAEPAKCFNLAEGNEDPPLWIPWPSLFIRFTAWNVWLRSDRLRGATSLPNGFVIFPHAVLLKAAPAYSFAMVRTYLGVLRDIVAEVPPPAEGADVDTPADPSPNFNMCVSEAYLYLLYVALFHHPTHPTHTRAIPDLLITECYAPRRAHHLRSYHLANVDRDGARAIIRREVRRLLARYFLLSDAPDEVLTFIYPIDNNMHGFYDLDDGLDMPNIVRYAVALDPKRWSERMCRRLGKHFCHNAGFANLGRLFRTSLAVIIARGLFAYPWTAFWDEIKEVCDGVKSFRSPQDVELPPDNAPDEDYADGNAYPDNDKDWE